MPVEELQNIDLPELPLSKLRLKVGVPIIVLRNLQPEEGVCNGTRMIITKLGKHSIQGRILGGDFHNQLRSIPRIKLTSSNKSLTYQLCRKQFPICVYFAITINKSQGQSFSTVGLDLRMPVFSHGQFYVAVSRTSDVAGLHILLDDHEDRKTMNEVYSEVLTNINN